MVLPGLEGVPLSAFDIGYLLAAALFIFGIKSLNSPKTAPRGNQLGASGMLVAIVVTLLRAEILQWEYVVGGVLVGALIGSYMAQKVAMTGIPQMVGLFNGFGGGASALVALAEGVAQGQRYAETGVFEFPGVS